MKILHTFTRNQGIVGIKPLLYLYWLDEQWAFKVNNYLLFCGHWSDGCFWFRIFKHYGIHFKNIRKHPLLFSERNGYWKRIQIKSWSIKLIKHEKYFTDLFKN